MSPHGGLEGVCRRVFDKYGVCAWLFCWPWSMHMPKYALCCAGGCIPCLCSKFAAQDLSHVQLWRTAIEYRPASNSSQCGMPIFGCCIFLHGKKKAKSSWQHCWAVTASCEVLILRTLTVKHVAPFLKSGYLWLHNYRLDMLLLFNMNLQLHLNLQITYTDFAQ